MVGVVVGVGWRERESVVWHGGAIQLALAVVMHFAMQRISGVSQPQLYFSFKNLLGFIMQSNRRCGAAMYIQQ